MSVMLVVEQKCRNSDLGMAASIFILHHQILSCKLAKTATFSLETHNSETRTIEAGERWLTES